MARTLTRTHSEWGSAALDPAERAPAPTFDGPLLITRSDTQQSTDRVSGVVSTLPPGAVKLRFALRGLNASFSIPASPGEFFIDTPAGLLPDTTDVRVVAMLPNRVRSEPADTLASVTPPAPLAFTSTPTLEFGGLSPYPGTPLSIVPPTVNGQGASLVGVLQQDQGLGDVPANYVDVEVLDGGEVTPNLPGARLRVLWTAQREAETVTVATTAIGPITTPVLVPPPLLQLAQIEHETAFFDPEGQNPPVWSRALIQLHTVAGAPALITSTTELRWTYSQQAVPPDTQIEYCERIPFEGDEVHLGQTSGRFVRRMDNPAFEYTNGSVPHPKTAATGRTDYSREAAGTATQQNRLRLSHRDTTINALWSDFFPNAGSGITVPIAVLAPPVLIGSLFDVSYPQNSGPQIVDASSIFGGDTLFYLLVSPPAGVTIDSGTGRITISTTSVITAADVTVQASNATGIVVADTFRLDVTVAISAPVVVGTLQNVSYSQGSGIKTVPTAGVFSSSSLVSYSLLSPPVGVTIDTTTGAVDISTTTLMTGQTVTVQATNAAGVANVSFLVTVSPAIVAPSPVGSIPATSFALSSGVQTIAAASVFAGTTPFGFYLDSAPAGVTINGTTGLISVSTTTAFSGQQVVVRATNLAGSATQNFMLSVTAAVVPPARVGTIADVTYNHVSGNQVVPTAQAFTGSPPLSYSLDANPAGVTINQTTGAVTIPTTALLSAQTITVRAANPPNFITQSFKVSVVAVAPTKVGTIADVNYVQNSGTQSVATAANFNSTTTLTYSLTANPSGVNINSTTGVVSITTGALLSGQTITVRAFNAVGSEEQSFKVTVAAPSGAIELWRPLTMRPAAALQQPDDHSDIFNEGETNGDSGQWMESISNRSLAAPNLLFAGGDMNGLRMCPDLGRGLWINPVAHGLQGMGIKSIHVDDANADWMQCHSSSYMDIGDSRSAASGIFVSKDRGKSWTLKVQIDDLIAEGRWSIQCIATWPLTTGTAQARTYKHLVQRARNASPGPTRMDIWIYDIDNFDGTAVRKAVIPFATFGDVAQFVQHPTNADTTYACTQKGLFRSTNWSAATPTYFRPSWPWNTEAAAVSRLWIDPNNPNRMIVSVYGNTAVSGVWWTVNGGTSWTRTLSTLDCSNIAVGAARANGDRTVYLHLHTGVSNTNTRYCTFKGDGTGLTAWQESARSTYSGRLSSEWRFISMTGNPASPQTFSFGDFVPHPTNPDECVMMGVTMWWKTTDAGNTFIDWNDNFSGTNPRNQFAWNPDPAKWDEWVNPIADYSIVEWYDEGLSSEETRHNGAIGLKSGRSACLLPNVAPVPAARRNWIVARLGSDSCALYGKPKGGGAGTWISLALETNTDRGARTGFCPQQPNWVASGRLRSNDAFISNEQGMGLNYNFLEWSPNTTGGMWAYKAAGELAWSSDFGATFNEHFMSAQHLITEKPVFGIDPHSDNRVYTHRIVNGRPEFCLVKGTPLGATTVVDIPILAQMPFVPVHYEPIAITVDPFDPTLVYFQLRGYGIPWLWRGRWNAGFTSITLEDITRNCGRSAHQQSLGVHPQTAEVIIGCPQGMHVLPPPPGHKAAHNITRALYTKLPRVPSNGFELLFPTGATAPQTVGSIQNLSFSQGSGTQTLLTASAFSGSAPLSFSLDTITAGVTINPTTGSVSILTTSALAATTITVRAANSLGSATQSFTLTITADVVAPAAVGTISDKTYGQYSGAQTVPMVGAFSGTALTYSLTAVTAGGNINATTGLVTLPTHTLTVQQTVTVKASNSGGDAFQSFKVTIQIAAPAAVGVPPAVNYLRNTGNQTVALSSFFSGTTPLAFSLTAGPAGVTVDAATGDVTIPTNNLLASQTITVKASNGAGEASQSFTVSVTAPVVATLPQLDPAQLTTILGKPLTKGTATVVGIDTNSYSGPLAAYYGYAAFAGQTAADVRALEQLRYIINNGANTPAGTGAYGQQHILQFGVLACAVKRTLRLWNDLTATEKSDCDLMVKQLAIGGAATGSDNAPVFTGQPTPARSLIGTEDYPRGNVNWRTPKGISVLILRCWLESDAAVTSFFNGLDHAAFATSLSTAGLTNAYNVHNNPAPWTHAQVEAALRDWSWLDQWTLPELTDAMITSSLNYTFRKTVTNGLNGGLGVVMPSGPNRGRIIGVNPSRPILGLTGMIEELDTVDGGDGAGGMPDLRSSMIYASNDWHVVINNLLLMLIEGTLDRNSTAIQTCLDRINIGVTDLEDKSNLGYYGYAHAGTGISTGGGSATWIASTHSALWGWSYNYGIWRQSLKPWRDAV